MRKEIELDDGVKLILQPSTYKNSFILLQEIVAIAQEVGIAIKLDSELFKKAQEDPEAFKEGIRPLLFQIVMAGIRNDDLMKAIFTCAEKCTLDDIQITEGMFEADNYRQYLFQVAFEIIKCNVEPFFPKAVMKSLQEK